MAQREPHVQMQGHRNYPAAAVLLAQMEQLRVTPSEPEPGQQTRPDAAAGATVAAEGPGEGCETVEDRQAWVPQVFTPCAGPSQQRGSQGRQVGNSSETTNIQDFAGDASGAESAGISTQSGSHDQEPSNLGAVGIRQPLAKFPSLEGSPPASSMTSSSSDPVVDMGISSDPVVDMARSSDPVVDMHNQNAGEAPGTEAELHEWRQREDWLEGLKPGSPDDLQNYLEKIITCERDTGICVRGILNPVCINELYWYRDGMEFEKMETLPLGVPQTRTKNLVFLCLDKTSKQHFVMKRIAKTNRRLTGTEFLAKEDKKFLLTIYGVHKGTSSVSIFQEFIPGTTLAQCEWNMGKVRKFAEVLLHSFQYLHDHNLAHCDIKLANLMVRHPEDPTSLVIIDFESAKRKDYPYYSKGHTLMYLPPWHDLILDLASYDPVLKTHDLWAIACVIMYFLQGTEGKARREVWTAFFDKLQSSCTTCRQHPHGRYCSTCEQGFKNYIKNNGHQVLQDHIGYFMNSPSDDPDLLALKKLLKYLTNIDDVREKSVRIALQIVTGYPYQPSAESSDTSVRRTSDQI